MDLTAFAEEVGADDPVAVAGGRTQWGVGGALADGVRVVAAPAGIEGYDPAEMVVRCGAGTTVASLHDALAGGGQTTALPATGSGTVGGALAVGRSDPRRLRLGPLRDALLEARYVGADGRVVKAGGPVVKNVTGFDLCRLLVGSLGTIGLLGEVVLRCVPVPPSRTWLRADDVDPFAVRALLFRPTSILWDGTSTWVLFEGSEADVAAESRALPTAFLPVEGGPVLPTGGRLSVRPSELRGFTGDFVAEVGVGIVHTARAAPAAPLEASARTLHERIKSAFDPAGRLSPGRRPW